MTRPTSDSEPTTVIRASEDNQAPPRSADDTQEFTRLPLDAGADAATSSDPAFRLRRKGYDREQVDSYRARLETDLATIRTDYEQAMRAQAQLGERLRAQEADIARLRAQLNNSPSALSDRLREILDLAGEDAEQTRAAAQAEAQQLQADAQAAADRIRADAEAVLKEAEEAAAQEQAAIRRQLADTAAAAERARVQADADAAARRDEADRQARERREQADAAAAAQLRVTSEQLAALTRERDEVIAALSELREKLAELVAP